MEIGALQPGNRVQGLLKTFMEQDKFFQRVNSDDWLKLLDMPLSDAYTFAADVMVQNMLEHDAAEGIGAVLDKRPPVWGQP